MKVKLNKNIPVVLRVKNNTNQPQKTILFNERHLFSLDKKVDIELKSFFINYEEMLQHIKTEPLNVCYIRISSENYNQVENLISVKKGCDNGMYIEYPIFPKRSVYQFQKGIVEIKEKLHIDFLTSLTTIIEPKTSVDIWFEIKSKNRITPSFKLIYKTKRILHTIKNKFNKNK